MEGDEEAEKSAVRLGSRDYRLQFIKERLIPRLDTRKWKEEYDPDADSVERSAEALSEQYHDLAVPEFYSTLIIIFLLGMLDAVVYLNPQVYGLFIDVWAAIFLVFPSLKGRYVMTTAVEGAPKDAIRRIESQEMVSANTGFVMLSLGFFLQIVSVQFLSSSEFIKTNILADAVSGWLTIVLLIGVLWLGFKSLNHLREKRLADREQSTSH